MRSGKSRNCNADLLNKRVELWGMVKVENEIGTVEHKPQKIKTIWASIMPQTGSIGTREGTEFAKMTHKIIVRYAAGKDILNTCFLKYANRKYDVLYTLNPYESNEVIEIFAQEVIE